MSIRSVVISNPLQESYRPCENCATTVTQDLLKLARVASFDRIGLLILLRLQKTEARLKNPGYRSARHFQSGEFCDRTFGERFADSSSVELLLASCSNSPKFSQTS